VLKASQKASFLVHPRQTLLDDLSSFCSSYQRGFEYTTIIVHDPDGLAFVVDDLLAQKVRAAKVAVKIRESALVKLKVA